MVTEVKSIEEFNEIIEKAGVDGKLQVVKLSAPWCGPCRVLAPIFEEVSEDHENVVFLSVDIEEVPDISKTYNVRGVPTILFFMGNGGTVVERMVGLQSKDEIVKLIEKWNK
jgi:thioredoxin 1